MVAGTVASAPFIDTGLWSCTEGNTSNVTGVTATLLYIIASELGINCLIAHSKTSDPHCKTSHDCQYREQMTCLLSQVHNAFHINVGHILGIKA